MKRTILPLFLTILTATIATVAVAAPPDSFYLDLLREGERALARGEVRAAARDLRLACFGLLDEPPLLAGCLGQLLLAQHGAGSGDETLATATRLVEVEERFEGFSRAELPAATRAAIEERLAALLPAETLARAPAFAALLAQRRVARLATLPERERARELERLAAAEPAEPRWRRELAAIDLDRGRAAEALARLEGLPPEGHTACLRGEALATLGRCPEALPALAACGEQASALRFARPRLVCLVATGELDAAVAHLESLPPAVRDDASLRRLRRDLDRARRRTRTAEAPEPAASAGASPEASTPPPATATEAPAAAPPPPPAPPAVEPAGSKPTSAERTRLDALAGQLAGARRAGELDAAFAEASALADRRPGLAEAQRVAGEIAYRMSRWREAATYLGRAGLDPAVRPELSFYLAVARFESGDLEGAKRALAGALPRLAPSPFVDSYRRRILAPEAGD
ncbi:MAG TPA: hypothetical protein PKM64_07775 [Thermoanaerobaculia bacterium]|nr:hypothetical protein [Thermoanaerobaculia bacterium]